MSRPSASVFVMSTFLPFSAVTMSPGRVECGPGMFSTAGASPSSGVPGASRATVSMTARTVQAPVLSIFISSIRSDGLMLMPPESKQTPLPTIARWRSSESRCPSLPERMTIIRGGLSLPRPTAMNMPIPSSVARSGSMTSIHRSLRSAIARASSARTSGVTSLAARLDSVRALFAPSPDDHAALGGRLDRTGVTVGHDQDQLIELRRRRFGVVAVDRLGVVRTLDHAAREQLRHDRGVAIDRLEARQRRQPEGDAADDATAEAARRGGSHADDDFAIDRRGVPRPDQDEPPGRKLADRRQRRGVALAGQLLEAGERSKLTARSPVELIEGPFEGRITDDRG